MLLADVENFGESLSWLTNVASAAIFAMWVAAVLLLAYWTFVTTDGRPVASRTLVGLGGFASLTAITALALRGF